MTILTQLESRQDEQRRAVADAALRVIARDGMDAASLRGIAHEMGRTTGVLTHYFRDKESLMLFTVAVVSDAVNSALESITKSNLQPASFTRAFEMLVDYNEDTDLYWRAWLAMTTASMRGGRVHAEQSRSYEAYRATVASAFEKLKHAGYLAGDFDVADAAIRLVAFVDGIGIQSIISPQVFGAKRRAALVRAYCADMFKQGAVSAD